MRTLALAGFGLAISSVVLAQQNGAISTPAASTDALALFAEFAQQNGGTNNWVVLWNPATGTPGTIYGTGLRIENWRENSLGEARRHALQLLKDRAELLGLGNSDFTEIIGARMARTWSFTFEQSFRGIPAIGGRTDVRINMAGVVAMFGSKAWPIPASFNTVPAIAANIATAAACTAMGGEPAGNAAPPRLVIWGDMSSQDPAPIRTTLPPASPATAMTSATAAAHRATAATKPTSTCGCVRRRSTAQTAPVFACASGAG